MSSAVSTSSLEFYLKGMRLSRRIQRAKLPETWIHFGALIPVVALVGRSQWVAALAVFVATGVIEGALKTRRLAKEGIVTRPERMQRTFEEGIPTIIRRELKRGRLEEKLGTDAVARLERCAVLANSILTNCAEATMLQNLKGEARAPYSRLGKSTEATMAMSFGALWRSLLQRRPADDEALQKLAEAEFALRALEGESERLRLPGMPGESLPASVEEHLEEIRARPRALFDEP